jgi:glycosyltransferase involved in cell wall biosynthesis
MQSHQKIEANTANKIRPTICFFNSNRAWGGGEEWHYQMARRLKKSGFPVVVITNRGSALYERVSGEDIALVGIRIGALSFLNPLKILRIRNILRSRAVQTIFLNLSLDLKTAGLAAKAAGISNIIYRRGLAAPVKDSFLNRFFYRHVITRLIVNSKATRQMVLANNPRMIPKNRINIIYNGLDLDTFDKQAVQHFFNRQEGEVLIGNCGRLVAQKGQHYLIKLAQHLRKQGKRFKILIAGIGELADDLKVEAEQAGVADDILFIGFVEDMKSFMHTIDIFVLTSLWEGFGYVIAEAMASRKPVVAFRVSSNPELIEHEETGFLVETGHVEELADKVGMLIDSPELRDNMGNSGRDRVAKKFNMPLIFSQVRDVIEKD